MNPGDTRLSIRVTGRMLAQLDDLAAERGVDRSRVVRQLLEAALGGRPTPPTTIAPIGENEIIELLTEKARAGNVSALRTLLAREESRGPRDRSMAALRELVDSTRLR